MVDEPHNRLGGGGSHFVTFLTQLLSGKKEEHQHYYDCVSYFKINLNLEIRRGVLGCTFFDFNA